MFDPMMCAVCVFVLLAWVQDCRRDKRIRERWQLRRGMSLEDELETRRRVLDKLNRRD
jgi:hypothetical protein